MKYFLLVLPLTFTQLTLAATNYEKMKTNVIELVSKLIEQQTVYPPGNETKATKIMADFLCHDRIVCNHVGGSAERTGLIARLPATVALEARKKPFLIMAHSDVVPTAGQSWSVPPHKGTLQDGYLYGRGALDDLGYAAITAEIMRELMNSKTELNRDIIFAFLPDEERGGHDGIEVVLKTPEFRKLIADAEFALNEGGMAFEDANGNLTSIAPAVAEKLYIDFELSIKNVPGGPSWKAQPQKALVYLSRAIARMDGVSKAFPVELSDLTREYLRKLAPTRDPAMRDAMLAVAGSANPPADAVAKVSADAGLNAAIRTTCVPTVISSNAAAPNILPTEAKVVINCRVIPGSTKEKIRDRFLDFLKKDSELKTFLEVSDERVKSDKTNPIYMRLEFGPATGEDSPISPLKHPVMEAIDAIAQKYYPRTLVVPSLLTAASDSRYTRKAGIPSYGVSPVFFRVEDVARVHNADERLPVEGARRGMEFFHILLLRLEGIDRGPASVKVEAEPSPARKAN